jgi:acetyl esterase
MARADDDVAQDTSGPRIVRYARPMAVATIQRGAFTVVGAAGAVHPAVRAMLDQWAGQPSIETLTPEQARRQPALFDPSPEPVGAVLQRDIPGPGGPLRIRLYRPVGAERPPALVYLHGGGFVIGSLEAADAVCRRLATVTGCAVVSVDYRLAPEHKYPAAVDDAYAALTWVHDNAHAIAVDGDRLLVGGSSAGANLAAVASLRARDTQGPTVAMQVLIVPALWFSNATESKRAFGAGYGLDTATMEWFARHYVRSEADATDPYVSPYLAPDLRGLPPAVIVTAEFDCLRDEGELYGERLRQAGVEATVLRYAGMIHGFLGLPDVAAGDLAIDHIGELVRARLSELA